MKIAVFEFRGADVFLFLPPMQQVFMSSWETRNNVDLRVSEANLPFVEDGPANVACGFLSVLVIQYSTVHFSKTSQRHHLQI